MEIEVEGVFFGMAIEDSGQGAMAVHYQRTVEFIVNVYKKNFVALTAFILTATFLLSYDISVTSET